MKHWDAGEFGCSRLITELKAQVAVLRDGEFLAVTAQDPGAPIDLLVWCEMTGNRLVLDAHPRYVIQRSNA